MNSDKFLKSDGSQHPFAGLTEGRMIHYVLPEDHINAGEHRAAIVVKVWNKESGTINAVVLLDGTNDFVPMLAALMGDVAPIAWTTSIRPDFEEKKPGTWHWIEPA